MLLLLQVRTDPGYLPWKRGSGGKPGGPKLDHTTKTGYGMYAFVPSGMPGKPGDVAVLESKTFKWHINKPPACFNFWYMISGPDTGSLTVSLVIKGYMSREIWTKRGSFAIIRRLLIRSTHFKAFREPSMMNNIIYFYFVLRYLLYKF